jgi:hypothetical protein
VRCKGRRRIGSTGRFPGRATQADGLGNAAQVAFISVMPALCMAISGPVPMATPTSAPLSAHR